MAIEMDLIASIIQQPKPFWLLIDLIVTIKWRLKKGEYDKPLFACFGYFQR
jgi:hypothetical protein